MVKIRYLTGPNAGYVCTPYREAEPFEVLLDLVRNNCQWEIDFSWARCDEAERWSGADLQARAVRAVSEGRPAIFMGVEYTTIESLNDFDDTIMNSGYGVEIASDDHNGLVVLTTDPM